MPSTEHSVLIDQIHLEDKTFQVTTETAIGTLAASIARLDMINPPVILGDDSSYVIVCGFRRIHACKSLGLSRIPVRRLSPGTDKRRCVQLAIADNSLQRPLNLIETSRALVLLSEVYPDPEDLRREAGALGLPDNLSAIDKFRKLSGLAPEIQEGVMSNVLSMAMAIELGQMEKSCGIGLARLFESLKLGLNKQREILTMIQEIALREHSTDKDVLNSCELQQIVLHDKWDRSQKTVHLRQYLRRRRYPSITSVESDFESHVRSLNLGPGIALIPPRDFEGTTFLFHLHFNNISQLQHHLSRLTEISSSAALNEILNACRISEQ